MKNTSVSCVLAGIDITS